MEKIKIFALDTEDKDSLKKYCIALKSSEIIEEIYAIKIGLLNIIDVGLPILKWIKKKTGLPVICDLKLSEIPSISADIAKKVASAGADGIVVQGFVGKKVIEAIQEKDLNLDIYVVTEMTHNDGGFTRDHLEDIATIAKDKRLSGVIGPGNRPDRIKKLKNLVSGKSKVIAAGVSSQQGGNEAEALTAGADFVIQGSEIREKLKIRNYPVELRTIVAYVLFGTALAVLLLSLKEAGYVALTQQPVIGVVVSAIFGIFGVIYVNKQ